MLGRIAMSLLGGTSIGATLMYLFDPDNGPSHRKTVKRTAAGAYDRTRESAASGWQSARDNAKPIVADLRSRLSDRLADASRVIAPATEADPPEYDDRLPLTPAQSYTAFALARHSRELHGEAREAYARARDLYYDALIDLDLARARQRRFNPEPKVAVKPKVVVKRSSEPDYLTLSLVAAGCCAAGAAAMFIMDPAAGRRRRALARDKASSMVHRTAKAARHTTGAATHYVQGRSRGAVARAKSAFRSDDTSDAKLVARIQSELGRVVTHASAIQVTASNGSVTLTGPVISSEFDSLMKCVYAVPGVREVINRLEPHLASA